MSVEVQRPKQLNSLAASQPHRTLLIALLINLYYYKYSCEVYLVLFQINSLLQKGITIIEMKEPHTSRWLKPNLWKVTSHTFTENKLNAAN